MTTTTTSENAAPEVADPLDVDGIVDDPCDALGTDQLDRLGVSGPGERNTFGKDDGCDWRFTDARMQVITIRPLASTEEGLSHVYERRDNQAYFEPAVIEGYPAVYASVMDERDSGGCDLRVGLTDELVVRVETTFLESDPCPVAEQTAEAMVEHLRDGT